MSTRLCNVNVVSISLAHYQLPNKMNSSHLPAAKIGLIFDIALYCRAINAVSMYHVRGKRPVLRMRNAPKAFIVRQLISYGKDV